MAEQAAQCEAKERYEHFLTTKQEKLRLRDALEGFFDERDDHHDSYKSYLVRRRMPAAVQLARQGESAKIGRLIREGVCSIEDLDTLLLQLQDPEDPTGWLGVLSLRDKLHGCRQFGQSRMDMRAEHILRRCRRDLYFLFPYLDVALMGLALQEDPACSSLGTDGTFLYYNADWVEETAKKDSAVIRRMFFHEIIHCLYAHPWRIGGEAPEKMDAADEQAEQVIAREVRRDRRVPEKLGAEKNEGIRDDHHYWHGPRQGDSQQEIALRKKWEHILRFGGPGGLAEPKGSGAGCVPGEESQLLEDIEKSRYDYRTYLQQFAVFREEMEIDMDSFDDIYYHLGMELYGDLPLIEPLEYREGHKVEELVIAIDTSGSVKLETVRHFLEETYAILDEKENFFSKMNVWIIQCDCVIEHVAQIRNKREWEAYLRELQIIGRSGTDFRPVFRYIEQMKERGDIGSLKGLLYFTDGDGIYPREAPDYQTAFVFVEKSPAMSLVPAWAKVLRTDLIKKEIT